MNNQRNAFTLIELLVVIAIIAILAAVLFPVFAQAREKARINQCSSNMKQIALAFLQYAQDYDEYTPVGHASQCNIQGGEGWAGDIYPYVKSMGVFSCPDDTRGAFAGGMTTMSYAMNYNTGWCLNGGGTYLLVLPLSKYAAPASTILITEFRFPLDSGFYGVSSANIMSGETNGSNGIVSSPVTNGYSTGCDPGAYCVGNAGWYGTIDPGGLVAGYADGAAGINASCPIYPEQKVSSSYVTPAINRHGGGGANYAFADGHVKYVQAGRVSIGGDVASAIGGLTPISQNATEDPTTNHLAAGTSGFLPDGVTPASATYSIF